MPVLEFDKVRYERDDCFVEKKLVSLDTSSACRARISHLVGAKMVDRFRAFRNLFEQGVDAIRTLHTILQDENASNAAKIESHEHRHSKADEMETSRTRYW